MQAVAVTLVKQVEMDPNSQELEKIVESVAFILFRYQVNPRFLKRNKKILFNFFFFIAQLISNDAFISNFTKISFSYR